MPSWNESMIFVYTFNKCLLSTHYVAGTRLDTGNMEMN